MEVYSTEEQQVEALRKWCKEKGKTAITVTLLILSLVLGVQYWRHHVKVVKEAASQAYQAMIVAVQKQDWPTAKSKAMGLATEYESTAYGSLAKLYLAKVAVSDQKLEEAKPYLQWVISHSKNKDFQDVARLRLAKILFSQKKSEEALALLDKAKNEDSALLQELKGDILLSSKQTKEAQAVYKAAYETMVKKEINSPLLKMKLDELEEE